MTNGVGRDTSVQDMKQAARGNAAVIERFRRFRCTRHPRRQRNSYQAMPVTSMTGCRKEDKQCSYTVKMEAQAASGLFDIRRY